MTEHQNQDHLIGAAEQTVSDWERVHSAIGILEAIELGLQRGYTPAELLDENSPIRDRIRAVLALPPGSPLLQGDASCAS